MIKILTIVAFILVAATGKAQEQVDSTTVVQLMQMADKVVDLDTMSVTPVIVVDSMLDYYLKFQDIEFKADKMMLLVWNSKGERIRIWLTSNRQPNLTVNSKKKSKVMPVNSKKKIR
jgi:hypothetical protein